MVSENSKVSELMDTPGFPELMDELCPGFTTNAQLKMAYGMTLNTLFPMMGVTDEQKQAVIDGIAKLAS